jgi:hypothetical protein
MMSIKRVDVKTGLKIEFLVPETATLTTVKTWHIDDGPYYCRKTAELGVVIDWYMKKYGSVADCEVVLR